MAMHHMIRDRGREDHPLWDGPMLMNLKGRGRMHPGDRVLVNCPDRSQQWYRVERITARDARGNSIQAQVVPWEDQ